MSARDAAMRCAAAALMAMRLDLDYMADAGLFDPCESMAYRRALEAAAAILDGDESDERRALGALAGTLHVGGAPPTVSYADGMVVRRLMPVECERLQGFPDGWTAIDGARDGPRYKAIGNSMAVPCMRWIGVRIEVVEEVRADAEVQGRRA